MLTQRIANLLYQKKIRCGGVFGLSILFFGLSLSVQSQTNRYIGIYFTGDAQMYYTGPSILAGSDFRINEQFSACFYSQYFKRDFGDHGFQTWSLAALGQINLGKRKRFYLAVGLAWQRAIEDDFNDDEINRSILIPAYRAGYHIIFKKFILSPEINLTGPYSYRQTTEIFTLPSIGTRLQFLRAPR